MKILIDLKTALLIVAMFGLYIGADWQTEIAAINVANGWPFGWPLCFLWPSNWAAFDFWRLVRYIILFALVALVFYKRRSNA